MSDGAEQPSSRAAEQAQTWGCQPTLEELYRYLDGAMEPEHQSVVKDHLLACNGCEDFFHFHSGLQKLIGMRCQSELPRDLPARVFKAITDQPFG